MASVSFLCQRLDHLLGRVEGRDDDILNLH